MAELSIVLVAAALLVAGVPIYAVLAGAGILLLLQEGISLAGIGQHALSNLNSSVLVAIPFFLLAAVTMRGGGIARVLFDAALSWIGWMRGGLALAGIAATTIFAAINGSSVATALAMGTLLVPMMIEKGYKPSFAMGLTASAATLGILIPPSLPMVLIGIIGEESVPRLFLAGVVPGLLQAALFATYVFIVAPTVGAKVERPVLTPRTFARQNLYAAPAYAIPLVVLGGIYGGVVTLTEAAVLGALISLVIALAIYRTARLSDVPGLLTEAVDRTAVIIVFILGASLLSAWVIGSGVPQQIAEAVVSSGMTWWQFLLVMNVLLVVAGMFIEGTAIILIVVPIVAPVLDKLGIDMTHFAVILIINVELGLLSPPVGLNLFVMSSVTRRPVEEAIRGTVPFFLIMLFLLILVTFVPAITTWLPDLVYGRRS
jgi:C4-dicarboxylate transporter DctM subunit